MRIGLFVPCYIDAFFSRGGHRDTRAARALRARGGLPARSDLLRPADGHSGFNAECAATEALFVRNFSGFDYIVAPSGSCVHHVRDNFDAI
jgi:L-lactate dehydrogenase complex protein LldE